MKEAVLNHRNTIPISRHSITIPSNPYDARVSVKYVSFVLGKIERNAERTVEPDLVKQIKMERAGTELEEGQEDLADRAIRDAIEMVVHSRLPGKPRVMQSSDGILTLEWHSEDEGALLIFGGDEMAAISLRRKGELYRDYGREIPVRQRLPDEVSNVLARLSE